MRQVCWKFSLSLPPPSQKRVVDQFQLREVLSLQYLSSVIVRLFYSSSSGLMMFRLLAQNKAPMTARDERDLLPLVGAVEGKRKFNPIFRFLPHPVAFFFFVLLSLLHRQVLLQSTATTAAASTPWQTTMLPDQSDFTSLSLVVVCLVGLGARQGLIAIAKTHTHIDTCIWFFWGLSPKKTPLLNKVVLCKGERSFVVIFLLTYCHYYYSAAVFWNCEKCNNSKKIFKPLLDNSWNLLMSAETFRVLRCELSP